MSLKDSFSQAVKDILKKDGVVNEENNNSESELDKYLDPVETQKAAQPQKSQENEDRTTRQQANNAYAQAMREVAPEKNNTYTEPQNEYSYSQKSAQNYSSRYNQPNETAQKPQYTQQQITPQNSANDEEQTIISKNTIIEGNIRSFANVTVAGSIKGDIQITKNASISGKVIGNVECNNALMSGSQMQGNVSSKGQVRLDKDSLILGNITAGYLDLNGKVKGNVDITGRAEFKSDAYIIGDITVSTLSVLEGATISGHINTTFLQDTPSSIFPEMITMGDLN